MSNIEKSKKNTKTLSLKEKLKNIAENNKGLDSALEGLELPRLFHQLVVFVTDGSGSMYGKGKTGETKGEEVAKTIAPIVERLSTSKNKNCFDIAAFAYSTGFNHYLPVTPVKEIQPGFSFNPLDHIKPGTTHIKDCLTEVEKISEEYLTLNQNKNAQVLVIILSDGAISDITIASSIANSMIANQKITLSSAFLETMGMNQEFLTHCQDNMRMITSQSDIDTDYFFHSSVDPEEVRKHMIKSISAVSKID